MGDPIRFMIKLDELQLETVRQRASDARITPLEYIQNALDAVIAAVPDSTPGPALDLDPDPEQAAPDTEPF